MVARPPVFLKVQSACLVCGNDIDDPLQLELVGRYCSARCLHLGNLRPLMRQGA